MESTLNVKVLGLEDSSQKAEDLARFGEPIDESDIKYVAARGLKDAAHRASNCMGWIWRQWLMGTPKEDISRRVEPFIERGLQLRSKTLTYDFLALHDLYLLHCAIFASGEGQLKTVVQTITSSSTLTSHQSTSLSVGPIQSDQSPISGERFSKP